MREKKHIYRPKKESFRIFSPSGDCTFNLDLGEIIEAMMSEAHVELYQIYSIGFFLRKQFKAFSGSFYVFSFEFILKVSFSGISSEFVSKIFSVINILKKLHRRVQNPLLKN